MASAFNLILFLYLKNINNNVSTIRLFLIRTLYVLITWNLLKYIWVLSQIIILSDDIEMNAGPKNNLFSNQGLMICDCNFNSVSAYTYTRVSPLSAYIHMYIFDIICFSDTYLNSETSSVDNNLGILVYNIIREDHLLNSKWGRVCVYYRNAIPLKVINVIYV